MQIRYNKDKPIYTWNKNCRLHYCTSRPSCLCGLMGRAFAQRVKGRWFESQSD